MDVSDKTFLELASKEKNSVLWPSDPALVSKDFWMPDHSCRVCYECDSQFSIINRRHHCRLCGRVFCGKCTNNFIQAPGSESKASWEELDRVRVCSYCFKRWTNSISNIDYGVQVGDHEHSTSPSAASFSSTNSSSTTVSGSNSLGSMSHPFEQDRRVQHSSNLSSNLPCNMGKDVDWETMVPLRRSNDYDVDRRVPSPSRTDDDDDEYTVYRSDSKTGLYPQVTNCDDRIGFNELNSPRRLQDDKKSDANKPSSSPLNHSIESRGSNGVPQQLDRKDDESLNSDECVAPSSFFSSDDVTAEPVDFENSGLLWLPPEPENEEDETEDYFLGDEDEGEGSGEWGYLPKSGSFGSGEFRNRDRSIEEHMKAMKDVVFGHFRALVSQLLQVENLPMDGDNNEDNWIDIITSLSWEAATLLKPDTSTSAGMDPGGYVKVKCIASGQRRDCVVVGGVVCKKNVAHRRMTSKIEKPRILILGGALEYQRVSNHLSSFDTLLQQEMDHLKMAVAKIDSHNPDVLLVENSVSRYAQEYLLAKDISLVLNIKRPLLERIARCTGAQIVPSVDHMSSPKLGYCDKFHVERFLEERGTAGHGGKKMTKTLMYFEGCPKPLGFTILLRGGNCDELKKVKRVVQYGVFAAYHLALETSFLADERASLPELPLKSPITVALPEKSLSIERSISIVPGFIVPYGEKPLGTEPGSEPQRANSLPAPDISMHPSLSDNPKSPSSHINRISSLTSSTSMKAVSDFCHNVLLSYDASENNERTCSKDNEVPTYVPGQSEQVHQTAANSFELPGAVDEVVLPNASRNDSDGIVPEQVENVDGAAMQQETKIVADELGPWKEEFPPSPSDHQSILVSLSSRCVWKGTVCERSHLFRIKYYNSFDKPLGRFLRDHLFDQSYRCSSCEMPSEAHVHCYTHRQGTLTISVRKLSEFLLPGEKDGKIWMWHRCLQCRRVDGFPPATRRVIMSDAAWGLSFGKFLELSFSNHAAASRVASCGHSLHRDCLRFYGFGNMVACFRYAPIDVLSVYLPPAKVEFSYEYQEWIKKEVDEVVNQADLLFSEVLNALSQIAEERSGSGNLNGHELRRRLAELEELLHKEKTEFEESLQKTLNREETKEKPAVDILEINRLRRQLMFQSIMWDHRLVFVASVDNTLQNGFRSIFSENEEKVHPTSEISCEEKPGTITSSSGFLPDDAKLNHDEIQGEQVDMVHKETKCGETLDPGEDKLAKPSASTKVRDRCDPLDSRTNVHRALLEGQFPLMKDLSETLDAKWIGENQPGVATKSDDSLLLNSVSADSSKGDSNILNRDGNVDDLNGLKIESSFSSATSSKPSNGTEDSVNWLKMPFMSLYRSLSKSIATGSQKMELLGQYNPVYISSLQESALQGGARLVLPVGVNDTVIPVYDDEPTSMISYALSSSDYHMQLLDEAEKMRDSESAVSFLSSDSSSFSLLQSFDEIISESHRSFGSLDESISSLSSSRSSLALDPVSYTKALHVKVSFVDDSHIGKLKFSVTCYYAKRFEALRRICCPSELDFIRSLSRCKKWRAQGGKSNVFFAKTLDDRFIIKQVTKTELEAFIKFAPSYFKYLSESVASRSPTCLAKILGIYQVSLKGAKESKMDVLVMENLLFGRNVTRLYDLKGSSRSRYNPDANGKNKVLLDQNLIELMSTSPIFVGNKAKRLLERAVWNDTSFLANVDVMDYSLLVGVDEEKHELVLGIIDFMRQYTWDKHLETWVKASGILGGPRHASPTVISPVQYKKRFRKAMTTYFLMIPDQWSPPSLIPSRSQSDLQEQDAQNGASVEQKSGVYLSF